MIAKSYKIRIKIAHHIVPQSSSRKTFPRSSSHTHTDQKRGNMNSFSWLEHVLLPESCIILDTKAEKWTYPSNIFGVWETFWARKFRVASETKGEKGKYCKVVRSFKDARIQCTKQTIKKKNKGFSKYAATVATAWNIIYDLRWYEAYVIHEKRALE